MEFRFVAVEVDVGVGLAFGFDGNLVAPVVRVVGVLVVACASDGVLWGKASCPADFGLLLGSAASNACVCGSCLVRHD